MKKMILTLVVATLSVVAFANETAVAFIKLNEGFKSEVYTCTAGKKTIGYGFTSKAIVAKGKKSININHSIKTSFRPYSILGCWIINHHYEAYKENDVVYIAGTFDINIWYSVDNNTKTDVIREVVNYKKDIKTKQIVTDYIERSDDVLIKILKSPTATNAKIYDEKIDIDVEFEILAEVLGETKMQVTVFKDTINLDDIDDPDIEIDEDFLGKK